GGRLARAGGGPAGRGGGARPLGGGDAPADHGDGPLQVRSLEHGEVGFQAEARRRQAEPDTAPRPTQVVELPSEVELDERPGGEPPGTVEGERGAQEARLEDGDARSEAVARTHRHLVPDVAEGVG